MNKTLMWVVIALVIAGGIVWYRSAHTTNTPTTTTSSNTPKPKNLQELLAISGAETCTFQNDAAGNSVQATIYVANGKLRGDFSLNANGKITYTHTIIDSTNAYTWMDGQTVGVKTPASGSSATLAQNINLSTFEGYSCTNQATATPDFTKFNLPKGVTFQAVQ